MQLFTHERGDGDKLALLIHGGMSDHGTWHAIEDEFVARGYRVVACDMRGHGRSPRGEYSADLFADDLVETLPTGADIAIGHSLGGLALQLAATRLAPKRAVLSDPAFLAEEMPPGVSEMIADMLANATAESVRAMNPKWSDKDIEAELAGFALFDDDVMKSIPGGYIPDAPAVPSLVQLAEESVVSEATAATLVERGFEVRRVPGTGHCIHRDSVEGFMASLEGWV